MTAAIATPNMLSTTSCMSSIAFNDGILEDGAIAFGYPRER
jgi:hypothetical protein